MQLSETIKETGNYQSQDFKISEFPKLCNPNLDEKTITCLQQYFIKNSENVISDLNKHGALLFRDFDIKSPNESVALLRQLGFKDSTSHDSMQKLDLAVGTRQNKNTNAELLSMFSCAKSSQTIHANLSSQSSQTHKYPQFVSLYCQCPAAKGGNILLMNWSQIYDYTKKNHPDFLSQVQEKGVQQITVLAQGQSYEHNMGNGWKNSFNVADRQEAQKMFKLKSYQFQWLNDQSNSCRLRMRKKQDSKASNSSGDGSLSAIISSYKKWLYKKQLEQVIRLGNGQIIPLQTVEDIYNHCQKQICQVQCREGDLLILNSSRIKHIHLPYQGPDELRKMYVGFMDYLKCKQQGLIQILSTGAKLPLIGFGTWKIPKQEAQDVVYNAIKTGYRLIDCAAVYGNEVQVGKGIQKAIAQALVSRQQLFVTSKLWNTYHRPQHVRPACERTLKDLGLDYLDLYLMHFPVSLKYIPMEQKYPVEWIYDTQSQKKYMILQKVPVTQTWKAMQDLIPAGLVRDIGVSNFTVALLRQLIYTCQIKPAVLQTEIHPQLNESKFIRYAREQGIQVTSYSTFGASSYVEIGFANEDEPIYKKQAVIQLAKRHQKTPHQIILRWAIQQGLAIIPKSVKTQRMQQNLQVTQFALPHETIQQISKLHRNRRYNDPGNFCEGAFGTFYPLHQ